MSANPSQWDDLRLNHHAVGEPLATPSRSLRRWFFELAADLTWPVYAEDRQAIERQAVRGYQLALARRARARRESNIEHGYWSGHSPYGYRARARTCRDEHGCATRRRVLAPDPARAPVVPVIYRWYDQLGARVIAARLAADADRYPPPIARQGRARGWTPGRVITILGQPAYTGYVVGNRYRDGQLLPAPWWIWSLEPAHPALIDTDTFWSVHARLHRHHRQRLDHEAAA